MGDKRTDIDIIYGINDSPELTRAIPLAFQHILAMFAGNITIPLLLASLLNLPPSETAFLIQCSLFVAGIATFIQIVKFKGIGSGLPIVMGTSNAFVSTVLAIGKDFGIEGVLGASFIGGIFEVFLGKNLNRLKKIFTPLVSGIVVLTIGITLIPVGIRQAAGGSGNMGDLKSILIASIVLLAIIVFNQSSNKFFRSSSILLGIVVGYFVSYFFGILDLSPILDASWFSIPKPFAYKWTFNPTAIIAMLFMYLATAIETIGDISAITIGAEGREATDEEMSGGVIADGLGSAFAALFNAFPNTSYTQNIGVISLTGVFSTSIVKIGAVILLVLSLFPKFASLIAVIPEPVLGGASIAMFSIITVSGLSLLREVKLDSRNSLIIAIAVGLGVGLNLVTEAVQLMPHSLQLFLTSGVGPSAIVAIVMDQLLPNRQD